MPNQALHEFWRHRQRAAGSPEAATQVAEDAIGKAEAGVKQALETWSKQVGLDVRGRTDLLEQVTNFAEGLRDELAAVHDRADARAGDEDPILVQLERLLDGRVTTALPDDKWKECVAEGRRRVEAEEPPGYRDAAKQEDDVPEGAAGDYLVWYQATRHAAERGCDLIIVTADEKEDWWWRQQATLLGPRPELTLEYHKLCGRRLSLLRPPDLLARAAALDVEVDQQSLADARRSDEDDAPARWTADALVALLTRLDEEAPVQGDAIRLAARSGGRVTREQVYELGGFPDDRMLRGFTRPPVRLTAALQAEGVVPDHVLPIFVARYPDGVKASYFSVPPEIADPVVSVWRDVPERPPRHVRRFAKRLERSRIPNSPALPDRRAPGRGGRPLRGCCRPSASPRSPWWSRFTCWRGSRGGRCSPPSRLCRLPPGS